MRIVVIHVTQRRSGAKARREEALEVDRLTVGRGTDNVLHVSGLVVPLYHCLFAQAADGVYVEAVGHSDLRVNGETAARKKIEAGDIVRVGQSELRVLPSAAGTDLTIEVEQTAPSISEADRLRLTTEIGIERGLLTRRKLSWLAVILVPVLFLGLPLLARRQVPPTPMGEKPATRVPLPPAPLSGMQRVARVIEASWNSGPLSTAHANFAGACITCHRVPYEPVRNQECLQCHPSIGRHARPTAHEATKDDERCADCHVEHRGDPGLLGFGSEMCASCHADLKRNLADTKLLDIPDFSADHAEFRPSVVVDAAGPQRERVALGQLPHAQVPAADAVQERSGLKFNHDKHLRENLRGPQGKHVTLKCEDCHTAERAGVLMLPPRYADHCQSCHPLSFDATQPARQVPHKQPQWIEQYTFEFYAAQVLQGEEQAAPEARRRPGKPMSTKEQEAAVALASSRAALANTYLLGPSGVCSVCHTLTEMNNRVAMAPIVLVPSAGAERWLPLSKFSHAAHTMAECRDCHAAAQAQSAGVVILPGIEQCRKCHGDRGSADEVPSTCMECHQYHHPDLGRLGASG